MPREFNPDLSLSYLPGEIRKYFVKHARVLYNELKEHKQRIELVDAPRPCFSGHKIRSASDAPPQWFSEICNNGLIKDRERVLRVLEKIINEKDRRIEQKQKTLYYKSHKIVRNLIFEHLTRGYGTNAVDMNYVLSPNQELRKYFGVKD